VNKLRGKLARRISLREERGAIAVVVAIFLVALLVIAALVLDMGTGYDHDRELQSAADAAALAGAQELINPAGNAVAFTQQYLAQNVSPGDAQSSVKGANVSASIVPAARSMTVDLTENHVPFNFAQVIGVTEGSVTAHAKAELMYLTATPMISPLAIPYLHPATFTIQYGYDTNSWFGGNSFPVNLTDPQSGSESDGGQYTGGTSGSLSRGGSVRVYTGMLTAKDSNGNDLMPPTSVGSLFVPPSTTYPIQSVDISRGGMGGAGESVRITVGTYLVTDPTVDVNVMLRSGVYNTVHLTGNGSGTYTGTVSISPSFASGLAVVSFVTAASNPAIPGSTWPTGVTLATYTMFQPGQSILYVDQNRWSGAGGTAVSAVVQTKAYVLGSNVTVSSSDMAFTGSYGATGFADMLTGANFDQELKVSLGTLPLDPAWRLRCDANGNNQADIGEQVPIDSSIRSTWGSSLAQAQGKVMLVALVSSGYPADTRPQWLTWIGSIPIIGPIIMRFLDRWFLTHTAPSQLPIVNFGAIQVGSVSVNGANFTLSGLWTRYLSTGTWTAVKPSGLYVETAVLTE
jgi:Flp pilus assembly protein TadG